MRDALISCRSWVFVALLVVAGLPGKALGADTPEPLRVTGFKVTGAIDGENISFTLALTAEVEQDGQELQLVAGDVVLLDAPTGTDKVAVRYDAERKAYALWFPGKGTFEFSATFAARATALAEVPWREASFSIPIAWVRELEVACDRTDLEVQFPGALRLKRDQRDGQLVISALLGPEHPFAVRWKPKVTEMEGKLVLACSANTVATISPGALRMDSLFNYDIAQGKLRQLSYVIPTDLNVTQVRCPFMRDWRLEKGDEGRVLTVVLNRPVTGGHMLQLIGEMVLPVFPHDMDLPVVAPRDVIRSSGSLCVGSDSAIQLVVAKAGGLAQVEGAAFPRIAAAADQVRALPRQKAFFYEYASTPYTLALDLDDITPAFDAVQQLVLAVKEDDLTLEATVELDVRDAPIRQLSLAVDPQWVVAAVDGKMVDDYVAREPDVAGGMQQIVIQFREPVLGRALVRLRFEHGQSPLGTRQTVTGIGIPAAKNVRGYLVVVTDPGVQVDKCEPTELRAVNTASIPMRVANAQYAYRFRDDAWSLGVEASAKPASVLVESFHLLALGEGVVYGSVAVNYFIAGAPVDELLFTVPDSCGNVEFVGRDVRRWDREGEGIWRVKLQRKVIGDYNLGVAYTQRYEAGDTVTAGGVGCVGVDTQSGYLAITSHLNLSLTSEVADDVNVIQVEREEIPESYRLLAKLPILQSYKLIAAPHVVTVAARPYPQGEVLPVLIEVMQIATDISINDNGQGESVTTIRYKVKNASAQYLMLDMPAGTTYWAVRGTPEDAADGDALTPIAAQENREAGMLMIPLPRHRDPNRPVTLELEYGHAHGEVGYFDRLALIAPRTTVRSTFAEWTVTVPAGYGLRDAEDATMIPRQRSTFPGGVLALTGEVAEAWLRGTAAIFHNAGAMLVYGVVCGLTLVGVLIFRRRAFLPLLLLAVLLVIQVIGLRAMLGARWARHPQGDRSPVATLTYDQAVDLSEATPPSVVVMVVPSALGFAGVRGLVVGLCTVLGCVAGAVFLRWVRWLMMAAGVVATGVLLALLPWAQVVLIHVLTWGLPLIAIIWLCHLLLARRKVWRRRLLAQLAAGLALSVVGVWSPDAAGMAATLGPLAYGTVVETVDCELTAHADHMEAQLSLVFRAAEPFQADLLRTDAILLSSAEPHKHVSIVRGEGDYRIDVRKPGEYKLAVTFLVPLEAADDDDLRVFSMPLPAALRNRVKLRIPAPGMHIAAPSAMRLEQQEAEDQSTAEAVFGPGEPVRFFWKPRTRQTRLEATVFFVETQSLFRFDAGLAEGRHQVDFRVAQGELASMVIEIPGGMTVTSVDGKGLGAWRYDPVERTVEARLAEPAVADYRLVVVTQQSNDQLPYTLELQPIVVREAKRQWGMWGIAVAPSVTATIGEHPQALNVTDFTRLAQALLSTADATTVEGIRYAYRISDASDRLEIQIAEVKAEIRTVEQMGFSVEDDRLVYTGELILSISKAGVFSVDLALTEGYDIDVLNAPQISHWDEVGEGAGRFVKVHFRGKLLGDCKVNVSLSKPVAELPSEIAVPRVAAVGSLKHTGQVTVAAEKGVRLTAAPRDRYGVSELDPVELGIRTEGVLAFRLLKPDWRLRLATEVVEPRINVDFLHTARVTEGMVRHEHLLQYRMHNAGTKFFDVWIPQGAIGLQIAGPRIARLEELPDGSGHWRVELAAKQFEEPYRLKISYETQYDRIAGDLRVQPVQAKGVDLQRGYVVVFGTDKVELIEVAVSPSLQRSDPRSVPSATFRVADLAGAAFCYTSSSADYSVQFKARRHGAADLLAADVLLARLTTVVTDHGESINRVEMRLRVTDKRHLEVQLPDRASVWSLIVNGGATVPSKRPAGAGREVLLVPLAQTSSGDLTVEVDLIYVVARAPDWQPKRQRYAGPTFDLPLKNLEWTFYLPEHLEYDDFEGTLAVQRGMLTAPRVQTYGIRSYEAEVARNWEENRSKAIELQRKGSEFAQQGQAQEAKQALEWAYNYSFSDEALNEDARVQLHSLMRQQGIVGLVNRRANLRNMKPGGAPSPEQQADVVMDQANMQRVQNSLSKAESENLERIMERMIETQEAAVGGGVQLAINMPLRGRMIRFEKPLQVSPHAEMVVAFAAKEPWLGLSWPVIVLVLGAVALICLVLGGAALLRSLLLRNPPLPPPVDDEPSELPVPQPSVPPVDDQPSVLPVAEPSELPADDEPSEPLADDDAELQNH